MINREELKKINNLLEKEKELKQVMAQINKNNFNERLTTLNDVSSSFKFENSDEFLIICNSIADIVTIRLENIENELNLYKILKKDE